MDQTKEQLEKQEKIKKMIIDLLKKTKRKGVNDLIKYLEGSDFFIAPASTRFHGNYPGGLAEHSLNVYNNIVFYYSNIKDSDFNLPEIPDESLVLAALLHDLCKINTYVEGFRWSKDENNQWVQIPEYKKEELLSMGHGAKSVFIAQQFMQLTVEEAQAIFWHMGAYDAHSQYMDYIGLGNAFNKNLLAFMLSQADMMATYISENELYY